MLWWIVAPDTTSAHDVSVKILHRFRPEHSCPHHNMFKKRRAVCRLAFGFSGPPCFENPIFYLLQDDDMWISLRYVCIYVYIIHQIWWSLQKMECGYMIYVYMMGTFWNVWWELQYNEYLEIIFRNNIWGISSHKFKYHKNQDFGQCSEWAYAV